MAPPHFCSQRCLQQLPAPPAHILKLVDKPSHIYQVPFPAAISMRCWAGYLVCWLFKGRDFMSRCPPALCVRPQVFRA